jgi:gliding motility-associated-like protein
MSSLLRVSGQNYFPDNMDSVVCAYSPPQQVWGIVQGYSSPALSHMYAQPFIGDIDNDGLTELVTVGYNDAPWQSSSIVIYGHDLQLKTSFNTSMMYVYGGYPLSVADVDRDGFAEIFIQHIDGSLRCYRPDGSVKWTVSVSQAEEKSPSILIADINGDGIPEVWSKDKIFNAVSGTLLVSLPEAIGYSVVYGYNGGKALMPAFADFDNDGILELAGGNKVYKLNITNSSGTAGNSASLWKTISANGTGDGLTSVADIDLDGFMDVVVVRDGCMYAWKPYSGTSSTPELIAVCPYSSAAPGSRALLADVNNDGYPEILFSYIEKITAYQYVPATQSLQQMWLKNTSDISGATTLTAFDFNQDGSVEIVYRDESDLRIIDGTTGDNISAFLCLAPTAVDYPAIVDLNRDGHAEIVASSSTFGSNQDKHARLVVFHSPSNAVWAPARYVWSQHAYNVVNINDDLTVPAVNFNPATPFTDPQGVVRRPFNNFLQQATTLDQYGRPFMSLANLAIAGEPVLELGSEVLSLEIDVCNTGEITFPAPMFLSAYTASGQLVLTEAQAQSLLPGECITVTLSISQEILKHFDNPYPLRIIVNNNGEGTAQYGGLQAECDTSDNTFHIDGRPCEITLYNVITPNGDGFNDVFEPQLEGDFVNIEMEIYDRWGKRVYRQEGKEAPRWDATGMPDGVYFCAIDYWCATSAKKRQRTNTSVTVVR